MIRKHGGYLASTPELELYVKPTNWDQLRHAIRDNHGAVIIGPSGTGKTLATRMLYEELRSENPNLERRSIRLGPQELEDDQTPPPVLYDIEDPWGRYDFDRRVVHGMTSLIAFCPRQRMTESSSLPPGEMLPSKPTPSRW